MIGDRLKEEIPEKGSISKREFEFQPRRSTVIAIQFVMQLVDEVATGSQRTRMIH